MTNDLRNGSVPLLSLDSSDLVFPKILIDPKPFLEISEQVRKFSESWKESFEPYRQILERWAEDEEKCKKLVDVGWVPHWSSLFDAFSNESEDLDSYVGQYYQSGWNDLKHRLTNFHSQYYVDAQTAEVFEQALLAHDAGLYRVNAKLIFPEIERMARVYLHRNDLNKTITSQRELIELIGGVNPSELKAHGGHGYRVYRILSKHVYSKANTNTRIDELSKSEIPNRHAALHGILPYNSAKSSLNSIFLFDFVVGVTSLFNSLDSTS